MHLAAAELLPFSMPARMERETHATPFHPVDYGPFAWRMTLLLPRNPLGTCPQDCDKALVRQLLPLMPEILQSDLERIDLQRLSESVNEATQNQVQLAVADAAHHAGRHLVRVNTAAFETHVRNVSEGHLRGLDGSKLDREHAVICVGADIADGLERKRRYCSIPFGTDSSLIAHVLSSVMERLPP